VTEAKLSGTPQATGRASLSADERLLPTHPFTRLLRRPEVGAAAAALVIFVFFSVGTETFLTAAGASTWLYSSSLFGIMAVGVALLMIGGEFDLSAGAMVGSTGLVVGIATTEYGLNIWVAIALSLAFALTVGCMNGLILRKTKVPSFIITLATFFALQGLNLGLTKVLTGAVTVSGLRQVPHVDSAARVFASDFSVFSLQLQVSLIWWLGVIVVSTLVLMRMATGNWIFASGGAPEAARELGVPVARVKTGLFMTTAGLGWLVGMLSLFDVSSVQATTGVGQEFVYIICAVVGGCMLTGGYGSVIGAAIGALIYGMTFQGIVFAGWDSNWLKLILGVMLLGAVLINLYVRNRALGLNQ
jgi:simple sugar transport system permease protein